jgi:hypothetical protein
MTPLIGFRANRTANRTMDQQGAILAVRPPAVAADTASGQAALEPGVQTSQVADYAYRIAAVTAGLFLLATVM